MNQSRPQGDRRLAFGLSVMLLVVAGRADGSSPPEQAAATASPITRIGDARSLPLAELARNPPVKLRAVVTRATPSSLFVQDETAGMYVNIARALIRGVMDRDWPRPTVPLGSEVEIEGVADPGGFSPIILPRTFAVLGPGALPAARPFDTELFFSGADDSQFVEPRGVVQDVREFDTHWRLSMATFAHPFLASLAKHAFPDDPRDLVDAEVMVRGPVSSIANTRGEFMMPWVFVERPDQLEVTEPAPVPVDAYPTLPLAGLATFHPEPRTTHRVQTEGTVIHVVPGEEIFLQDGAAGLRVTARDTSGVKPGDRVQAVGFVHRDGHVAGLAHAVVNRLDSGPPPEPLLVTPQEITAVNERAVAWSVNASPGDYSGCLVRFPARLVDRQADGVLVLDAGTRTVVARVADDSDQAALPALGSLVEVTGIASLVWEFDPLAWPRRRPRAVALLARSASDLRLLEPPPFWTPRRLAIALALAVSALGGIAAWAWSQRRRRAVLETIVAERTHELAVARAHEKQVEEEARVTLEKKLRSSLSAAAIAHEINQPLSRILLRCRMGELASEEPPGLVDVAALAHDAKQIVTTIDKMKVLLRSVQTPHAAVDFAQVARSSLLQMKHLLARAGVSIHARLPAEGCQMQGDDVQLQLAITNLVRNAVEAITTAGGGRREIMLAVEAPPAAAVLEVADSGPGWPGGSVDETLLATTKPSGTGVGLFVVRTVVKNHGGSLEITRSPLGGASFRLSFPRPDESPQPPTA
jgi:signal transduction histidine kinase